MERILTITRWSRFTICCLFLTIANPCIANEVAWVPAFGTLTTLQTTDIKLISQKIELFELTQVLVQNRETWVFDAAAEYALHNTSRTKKKPTILIRICTVHERFDPHTSCELEDTNLVIKVDGHEITWTPFSRDARVYARFSLKFGPKTGRKVTVTHRLFERNAADYLTDSTDYMTFDYYLEDSAAWDGPVGSTYFSAKLPFKSTGFNVKAFSNGERFSHKNRLAFFTKKKLELDQDDGLSFYVTTPSYKNKVDRFRRHLRAAPHSPKRHLALAAVLAAYPGAHDELFRHVEVAMKGRLKKWPDSDVQNAASYYSKYLIDLNDFKETQTPCDETICIGKSTLEKTIDGICRSNRCTENNKRELAACCAPKDSAESKDYAPGSAIDELDSDSEEPEHDLLAPHYNTTDNGSDIAGFMLRYAFLLLMAALGFIGITGWIIFRIKTKDKPQRYTKTLH